MAAKTKVPFRPLGERILIEPFELGESTSRGGIILPQSVADANKSRLAKVLAIGADVKVEVKAGDTIVYNAYAGIPMERDGKKYLTLDSTRDVQAVVND